MPDQAKSYDRMLAALDGMPNVAKSKASTVRVVTPLLGNVETFILQTYRDPENGDTIFIEHTAPEGFERYYLPPAVVRVLMRHRDHLETQNRRRAGRQLAEQRKADGIAPAFLRGRCKGHEPEPGAPNQRPGETFYCDGTCRARRGGK